MSITTKALAKGFACLYLIVSKALVPIGVADGRAIFLTLALAVLSTLLSESFRPRIHRFLVVEFLFVVVSALISCLVAGNNGLALGAVQALVYGLLFGYVIFGVSRNENGIDWLAKAWIISCVVIAGYIFLTGGYTSGKIARLSVSEDMNVNTLGVFLTFGIWAVLYLLSKSRAQYINILFAIALIAVFMYLIYATASRKSFIGAVFLLLFWICFSLAPYLKKVGIIRRAVIILFTIAVLALLYFRFGNAFQTVSGSMTIRMQRLSGENITDMHRFALMKDALYVFSQNPAFGVGLNNYKLYSFSGQYSHCTYVEVLACTGIAGSFFAYYLWGMQFRAIVNLRKGKIKRAEGFNIFALFALLLFIDFMQIMYYNTTLLAVMHMLYAMCIQERSDKEGKLDARVS